MNEKIYHALNEQIKHEFYSSHLYLSIASYFENVPLDGIMKWFRKQAQEEHLQLHQRSKLTSRNSSH